MTDLNFQTSVIKALQVASKDANLNLHLNAPEKCCVGFGGVWVGQPMTDPWSIFSMNEMYHVGENHCYYFVVVICSCHQNEGIIRHCQVFVAK